MAMVLSLAYMRAAFITLRRKLCACTVTSRANLRVYASNAHQRSSAHFAAQVLRIGSRCAQAAWQTKLPGTPLLET